MVLSELTELASGLGISGVMRMRRSQLLEAIRDAQAGKAQVRTDSIPITIYLSDEASHHDVESAVERLLEAGGLVVVDREDPVIGSWFRRIWINLATVKFPPRTGQRVFTLPGRGSA
jgi:hypothetical protein